MRCLAALAAVLAFAGCSAAVEPETAAHTVIDAGSSAADAGALCPADPRTEGNQPCPVESLACGPCFTVLCGTVECAECHVLVCHGGRWVVTVVPPGTDAGAVTGSPQPTADGG